MKLSLGHVVPASVLTFWQTPVLGSHGPSPVFPAPSNPPTQVCAVLASLKVWPAGLAVYAIGLASEAHGSKCPISCSISTPPSSAAHGTWFCWLAVLYSGWKLNGVPAQVLKFVFMNPFLALATMKPVWWVVRSRTAVSRPCRVSRRVTASVSPGFISSV